MRTPVISACWRLRQDCLRLVWVIQSDLVNKKRKVRRAGKRTGDGEGDDLLGCLDVSL